LAYCEFYADMPVQVTGYRLTSSNLTTPYNPTVWTLKAKLYEDDEWIIIDSRNANKNSSDALSGATAPKDYTITADKLGAYKYFRFEVTENGGASQMCLSGLDVQGAYAGVPKNIVSPTFTDVFIDGSAPAPVTFEGGQFTGNYDYQNFTEENTSIIFLGAENTLYYPQPDLLDASNPKYPSIGAFRAYFQFDGTKPVRAFRLNFGDGNGSAGDPARIHVVEADGGVHAPRGWYTLDGRKLDGVGAGPVPARLRKGIYLHGGKKVVVK
jgi:hypothetical protein